MLVVQGGRVQREREHEQGIVVADNLKSGGRSPTTAVLRAGVLVVQSNRAGSGRVLRREREREQGIVVADNLNPQKARVLAILALTVTDDPEQVQRFFEQY